MFHLITSLLPSVDQLITPSPRGFDLVATNEQRLITDHRLKQQTLISIRRAVIRIIAGEVQIQRTVLQVKPLGHTQLLHNHMQTDALVGLQTNHQTVRDHTLLFLIKDVVRVVLVDNHNLGHLLRHALTGT